jgi:hypothetical protein
MSFDSNNNYTGTFFGADRIGHTHRMPTRRKRFVPTFRSSSRRPGCLVCGVTPVTRSPPRS